MALAADRNTPEREDSLRTHDVAASVLVYQGALVMLDTSGNAKPAAAASALTPAGVAVERVDNSSGSAGDKKVTVKRGTFRFANGDTITKADIGDLAFAMDDQTVGKTSATRSAVGRIVDVDSAGVWVEIGSVRSPDAANADTSGAVLADLETEVNQLKATMRKHGLLAQ